ncbi:MAG: hypothetical protein PHN80_06695 [Hespellia sp.]|nr:hypothetical protein [Hespellia sp.]
MSSDLNGMISVLILGCGLYILYSFYNMKKTGVISETLLSGKNIGKKCKDKEGFLKESLPYVLILGIFTVLYGAIDMVNNFVTPLGMIDVIAAFVFVAVLIFYVLITQKLKKKYY